MDEQEKKLACYERTAIVMVLGISGSGKTTSCKRLAAKDHALDYASASDLLKQATGKSSEQLRTSSKKAIQQNQRYLVDAIHRARKNSLAEIIIIDAHATIFNDSTIVEVPAETFKAIKPSGFVLLNPSSSKVLGYRIADKRHRPRLSLVEIEAELQREKARVEYLATILSIPLAIITEPDPEHLRDAIDVVHCKFR